MYQDPTSSDQAKRLRQALLSKSINVSHAQALEVIAIISGVRTLHVAQAKKNAGVRIADAAQAQAVAVMFETLGAYVERVQELMACLVALGVATDAAQCDQEYRRIFRGDTAVIVRPAYAQLSVEELPAAFASLTATLTSTLVALSGAPAPTPGDVLFAGPIVDWQRIDAPELIADHQLNDYDITVKRSGQQFYVDIGPKHSDPDEVAGKPQLSLVVEVNDGLPCVHMTNNLYGDQLMSIFSTEHGFYLRPEKYMRIVTDEPGSHLPALKAQYDRERAPYGARGDSEVRNHAFLESSNR